jgi:hypothetical protein
VTDFPCIELVAWPLGRDPGLSKGVRVPLEDGLSIGRARKNAVSIQLESLGREHVRIEQRFGRWWAADLGSSYGTLHNGQVLRDAELLHGDTLELPWGLCFTMWYSEPSLDHHPAIEADVLAHPDDEHRWNVWADWLLERGLALGERVRIATRNPDDDGRFLATMGGFFRSGWLDVDWQFGFPRRAVIRAPGPARHGETPGRLVSRLFEEPAFRFLRHLEIDSLSFGTGLRVDDELNEVLEVLARVEGPRWLETLRFGPLPMAELTPRQAELFAKVKHLQPRLTTNPARLLQLCTHASLEVLSAPLDVEVRPKPGATAGLVTDESHLIGQLDECVVRVTAADSHPASRLAVRIEQENGRWLVEDLAARAGAAGDRKGLRVNGRETLFAHVRDGDLLELVSGLVLRFRVR